MNLSHNGFSSQGLRPDWPTSGAMAHATRSAYRLPLERTEFVLNTFPDAPKVKVLAEGTPAAVFAVGFQNMATVPDQRFQAAVSYSLMRPPRIGRRRILPSTGSGTGDVGRGGRNRSARCGRRAL